MKATLKTTFNPGFFRPADLSPTDPIPVHFQLPPEVCHVPGFAPIKDNRPAGPATQRWSRIVGDNFSLAPIRLRNIGNKFGTTFTISGIQPGSGRPLVNGRPAVNATHEWENRYKLHFQLCEEARDREVGDYPRAGSWRRSGHSGLRRSGGRSTRSFLWASGLTALLSRSSRPDQPS